MAKSARASSRKAAKTRLRNTVYAPAEQARLERLSQKLRDTINASSTTGDMEVDRQGLSHRLPSIPSCPSPPRAITKNKKGGRRDRSISPSPSTFALALASRGEVNGLGGNGEADYSSTIDTNARDESSTSSNGNDTSMLNAQDANSSLSTNKPQTSTTSSSSSSKKRKPIVSKSRKALVFSGISKKKKGSKATKKGGRR